MQPHPRPPLKRRSCNIIILPHTDNRRIRMKPPQNRINNFLPITIYFLTPSLYIQCTSRSSLFLSPCIFITIYNSMSVNVQFLYHNNSNNLIKRQSYYNSPIHARLHKTPRYRESPKSHSRQQRSFGVTIKHL